MSAYRWWVKNAWIGIMNSDGVLLGILARSGVVRACGHFCSVEVQIEGKKRIADNAEARIFPFHSVTLEKGEAPPKKMEARGLGWMMGGNDYAYLHKRLGICKLVGPAAHGEAAFDPIRRDDMKPEAVKVLDALLYPTRHCQDPRHSVPCPLPCKACEADGCKAAS